MKTVIAMAGIWTATIVVIAYVPSSPFDDLGGDKLDPAKVKGGGTVKITRNFNITRETPVTVSRSLIRGNCSESCEIIDLPLGKLNLPVGEYRNVEREHVIPLHALPGVWRFVFVVHWHDRFGRNQKQALAPLEVEVIR